MITKHDKLRLLCHFQHWLGTHYDNLPTDSGSMTERSQKFIKENEQAFSLFDVSVSLTESKEEYEPYFGWCNVEGCENEGANGGGCWRDTGYWIVCSKHSSEYREGNTQPPMKQSAIDREKRRGKDGVLVNEG
jgi:hypothetical protein